MHLVALTTPPCTKIGGSIQNVNNMATKEDGESVSSLIASDFVKGPVENDQISRGGVEETDKSLLCLKR